MQELVTFITANVLKQGFQDITLIYFLFGETILKYFNYQILQKYNFSLETRNLLKKLLTLATG